LYWRKAMDILLIGAPGAGKGTQAEKLTQLFGLKHIASDESRLGYFPMNRLKGRWLIVPNFPSKKRYPENNNNCWKSGMDLKMIYQGRVSNEHGLEEMLEFVGMFKDIQLTIIGPGDENYIQSLRNKISTLGINDRAGFSTPVAYEELRQITQKHHIGLAVNKPVNILYSTAAQASNKIYEYAASGLPVLYYKNEHYMQYLGAYTWAFPTDLSEENLKSITREIKENYQLISENAIADFRNRLNFGVAFKPVISILLGKASDN
jgi:glycosyltransferase involved in cell wall biosynthesis